ncbi:Neurotoxin LmNaTx64.1 [Frankliniella fusca]|uniref:Neurotoxin LmNaTx64.1 n=1 Tax=Frankliniella fusca TaxID=407009 RepID=A0AAE1HUM4_9NEOP|nr:Neurotoxin LmNaTx64.1 [Frankliniella fusca]
MEVSNSAGKSMRNPQRGRLSAEQATLEWRANQGVHVDYPPDIAKLSDDFKVFSKEGYSTPGDSGSPQDVRPPWFDEQLFQEGQRVARENHAGMATAEAQALFLLFAFPAGLDPLISTARSDTPETAGRRYLSTNLRLLSWITSDPFDPQSECYRNLVAVRRMHANVRKACNEGKPDELAVKFTVGRDQPRELICPQAQLFSSVFASVPGGSYAGPCPVVSLLEDRLPRDLGAVKLTVDRYRRPFLTQGEMAITQWGFFGLFILKPHVFAAPYISRRELEAVVHVWAVLGYCLGIDDKFNWALGGLDLVMRRSEIYLRTMAVPNLRALGPEGTACWEHMCRCMVDGMRQHMPMAALEVSLTYLTEDVLGLGTVLPKALTWRQYFQLWRLRLFLQYLPRWFSSWPRVMSRGLGRVFQRAAKSANIKCE